MFPNLVSFESRIQTVAETKSKLIADLAQAEEANAAAIAKLAQRAGELAEQSVRAGRI